MDLGAHVVARTLRRPQQGRNPRVRSTQRVRRTVRPGIVGARHRASAHVTARDAGPRARAPRAATLIGRPLAAGAWFDDGAAFGGDCGVVVEEAVRRGQRPDFDPLLGLSAGRLLSDDDRAVLQVHGETVQVRRVLAARVVCNTMQYTVVSSSNRVRQFY